MSYAIIFVEAVIISLIFCSYIVCSTMKNPLFWFDEYPESIRNNYLKSHPEHTDAGRKSSDNRKTAKIIFMIICLAVLTMLIYGAGARSFVMGLIGSYIIWAVVNIFDVLALDLGILAHWKKVRLPGTEHMDKEYQSNKMHHIKGGLFGMVLGIPVSLIVGLAVSVL